MTADVAALAGTARRLRDALAGLRLDPAVPGADAAGADAAAMVRQLDDHVLPRLGNLDAPALVVIGGSTGSGKSLLTNSLVGQDVTRPGYLRPTTTAPVLVHDPADAAWFGGGQVLPGLARVVEGEARGQHEVRLVASDALTPGLALLDSPDIDSVSVPNRTLAAELLAAADLWVFVTTASRYADAVPWDFLEKARRGGTPLVVVVNRCPAGTEAPLTDHLRQMLTEQDLADTPVVAVTEQPLVEGRLPADAVGPLRAWLDRLGTDRAAREAAVRRSLQGSLGDLAARADRVCGVVARQAEVVEDLRDDVRTAYAQALRQVGEDIDEGTVLRGEVLARWEELLGTGELFRQLRSGLGRLRDQVAAALTGRRQVRRELDVAVESVVQTLVRTRGDAAAAQVAARWRARPAGLALMTVDERAAGPGGVGALSRSSAQLDARAAQCVRAWQGELLDLVREVGGDKKVAGRVVSLGVNGAAAVVMVLVFSQTGGLTGAEVAVAGGASAVGHTLLEALLGDQAIRTLAARARALLEERVGDVYRAEAERYEAALAPLAGGDVDAEALRALADELGDAAAAGLPAPSASSASSAPSAPPSGPGVAR